MQTRCVVLAVASCVLFAATPANAQTTTDPQITFHVPLNLTQVSSDITKVAVWCVIESTVITTRDRKLQAQVELPISGGQLVTTVTVNVAAPSASLLDPINKPAQYGCTLSGFSASLQRWGAFNAASPDLPFRLSPTPQTLTGSFNW